MTVPHVEPVTDEASLPCSDATVDRGPILARACRSALEPRSGFSPRPRDALSLASPKIAA
jgi:hypothetical protein